MEFQWVKGSTTNPAITIYANNITLNNAAAKYMENSRYCLLGIDSNSGCIAIKPISKRDIDLNIYDPTNLNKISMGKGYARISNKTFIDEINKALDYNTIGLKFEAMYSDKEEMLIVDLKKGEMNV